MTEIISLKYRVNISKEHVRKALVDIDPEGVSMRKKKTIKRREYETNGPFNVFHIDGNNKLKRFGFALHGYIDGFSRKLIFLFVSTTNSDPLVVANLYLKAITADLIDVESLIWISVSSRDSYIQFYAGYTSTIE